MALEHDFKKFPELSNSQFSQFYWDSPHKQIVSDFRATVVKVTDADTIRVKWVDRDFDFPIRFAYINAEERGTELGERARERLSSLILGEEVDILIDSSNRVGKFGRLIGTVIKGGENMNNLMLSEGFAVPFGTTEPGIPSVEDMIGEFDGT